MKWARVKPIFPIISTLSHVLIEFSNFLGLFRVEFWIGQITLTKVVDKQALVVSAALIQLRQHFEDVSAH